MGFEVPGIDRAEPACKGRTGLRGRIVIRRLKLDIPVVALKGLTIFPGMVIHFDLNRKPSIVAVRVAMKTGGRLLAVTQRVMTEEAPGIEGLYEVGTIIQVRQITKLPNNTIRVLAEGIGRARLNSMESANSGGTYALGDVTVIEEDDGHISSDRNYEEAAFRMMVEMLSGYLEYHPGISQTLNSQIDSSMNLGEIVGRIAMNIPLSYDKKQMLLEAPTTADRYEILSTLLCQETDIAKIHKKLNQDIQERVNKHQREYIMREQMAYIRKELSKGEEYTDSELFMKKVDELEASDEIKDKIRKEIRRFDGIADSSQEGYVQRSYIETLIELPWDHASNDNTDLQHAGDILEADHYGLEKVKERVLEFLAVRALTSKGKSPIMCLVGPPGTGKTSVAKSIAKALDKQYIRVSLGGVRDEAEIRGHRRTYVGAMPGRIASGLRNAGVKNPLMLLDEIDKVSNDYKGDTFSALLEVLDPDQNRQFRDHYVELPIDLSDVLFIATANDTSKIPRPLLDRMELIEVSGYTQNEKFHIAKEHLMSKQYEANGMTRKDLVITDGAIRDIIRYYTREAGVRELERKLGEVCRKCARDKLDKLQTDAKKKASESSSGRRTRKKSTNTEDKRITVGTKNLEEYLGKRKYSHTAANKKDEVGIVRGLAWTAVGGETLQIEVNMMPGKGEIKLTGQMGDVMKESASIAMSYVRSVGGRYRIDPKIFSENDFHIHIPEGAVPKDGPSAGITMATAILSTVTGRKVYCKVAMTGEITLRGKVLPIGGLKEKLLAAKVAGIRKVLVPAENEKDVEELSDEILGGMDIVFVSDMDEVVFNSLV